MIKLIASDIDGTLVKDGTCEINEEIFDCIRKLHNRGIIFVAATGRHSVSIDNLFAPVADKIFYVSDNGAYIGMKGRSLFLNGLERSVSTELVDDLHLNPKLLPVAATKTSYYIDKYDEKFMDWLKYGYQGSVKYVEDFSLLDEEILKISVYCENIYNEADYIIDKYKDKMNVKYSGTMWLDCSAKGVSKGYAIKTIQESLGISERETLVFGDHCNDIEMLESAYYSFAMDNAVDELKAVARFQTKSNVSDGVLDILNMLL